MKLLPCDVIWIGSPRPYGDFAFIPEYCNIMALFFRHLYAGKFSFGLLSFIPSQNIPDII